jgi:DNA invertase Pin-like site-specific DNA recombinase
MQPDRAALVGPGARYHRVSTSGQDTERQEADIDRWLATIGAVCSDTYTDHDSRDKAEERYDFQRLMGAVQSKAVN